jgi:hypothetical protein
MRLFCMRQVEDLVTQCLSPRPQHRQQPTLRPSIAVPRPSVTRDFETFDTIN